jgi:signal transduction histidine kinase
MDSEIRKGQKEFCESIMKMLPFGVLLVSHKKDIDYHNEKFAELFGHINQNYHILSQWLNTAFPSQDLRKQVYGILFYELPYTESGNRRTYTVSIFDNTAEEKLIQFTSMKVEQEKFLILCEDVTDIRKQEAQFQHAQKMEAIGSMAGGVAHDVNNILMGIQGYVSLMLLETLPSNKNYEKLKAIEAQINSGSQLTEQLLECARGGRFEPKTTELNDFLNSAVSTFTKSRKEISISTKFSAYVWAVEADTSQLDQAFQNIFTYAAKILGGIGGMLLRTDNIMLDHTHVSMHGLKSGPYVRISITVPGVAIDESERNQLFSPSSVLKDAGRQGGMGLTSAYGVIKSHGGLIEVISDPDVGTVFHVFIPASSKTPHKKKQEFSSTRSRMGNETILLVDDEKVITDVTGAMLSALGYDVIVASDGEEAVAIYQEKGKQIDLVIMDVVMPGMGGGEAIDLIREINPSVKVILCSGYSMSGAVKAIMDKGVQTFLKKPFKMDDFSMKIREVLES